MFIVEALIPQYKDSNMFRRFDKVQPYTAGLVFGWVTKCKFPLL